MAGNPNPQGPKSDKIWRSAIMRAVQRLGADPQPLNPVEAQRLDLLADAIVAKGIAGDVPAAREIGDRLDGRPHQTAEITQTHRRACDYTDDELMAIAGIAAATGPVTAQADEDQ